MARGFIPASTKQAFGLSLPLHRFPVGRNTLRITTTSSGTGIHGSRSSRTVHFRRCLAAPVFTG